MRRSGILMPVSSLPSEYGIGSFSKEAYEFVDFLESAGQKLWQILPRDPQGTGIPRTSPSPPSQGTRISLIWKALWKKAGLPVRNVIKWILERMNVMSITKRCIIPGSGS